MIKFITALLLTALLAYTAFLYSNIIPWWGFSIGAFVVGLVVPQRAWVSWLSGFSGLFICWAVLAWNMDKENAGLLSAKMAMILPLGGSSILLVFITAFIGALISGFAALSGAFLHRKQPAVQ